MRRKKTTSAETHTASSPIELDTRRTRERLLAMERRNPLGERLEVGDDNTPLAAE